MENLNINDILLALGSIGSFVGVLAGIFSFSWIKKAKRLINLLIDVIEFAQDPKLKQLIQSHFSKEDLDALIFLDQFLDKKGIKEKSKK